METLEEREEKSKSDLEEGKGKGEGKGQGQGAALILVNNLPSELLLRKFQSDLLKDDPGRGGNWGSVRDVVQNRSCTKFYSRRNNGKS